MSFWRTLPWALALVCLAAAWYFHSKCGRTPVEGTVVIEKEKTPTQKPETLTVDSPETLAEMKRLKRKLAAAFLNPHLPIVNGEATAKPDSSFLDSVLQEFADSIKEHFLQTAGISIFLADTLDTVLSASLHLKPLISSVSYIRAAGSAPGKIKWRHQISYKVLPVETMGRLGLGVTALGDRIGAGARIRIKDNTIIGIDKRVDGPGWGGSVATFFGGKKKN